MKGFDPAAWLPVKRINRSSRASQLAVAAAREAAADAGFGTTLEELDAAVVINSAVSGYPEIQDATRLFDAEGIRPVSPSFVASSLTNMPACEVAIDLAVHGPVNASALACASGTHALLEARRTLLAGDADVVVAGGTDAAITPVMFAGLTTMRGLSRSNDVPQEASRPFDAERDGFVFGEGAVVCVMETLSHARARGARVYAEVLGGAMTSPTRSTLWRRNRAESTRPRRFPGRWRRPGWTRQMWIWSVRTARRRRPMTGRRHWRCIRCSASMPGRWR